MEEIFNSTVQISAPIRNRQDYLPSYLKCLYNLDYDKNLITMRFLVNDSTDNSLKILEEFKKEHKNEYRDIIIDIWNRNVIEDARIANIRIDLYEHFSAIRNRLLRTNESDYYFSVDSDIMVESDSLKKLIKNNVDIVAGLIINGNLVRPDNPKDFPNILIEDKTKPNQYVHVSNWRALQRFGERLIEVDFTGAIILMTKKITKNKSIFYASHFQGEDLFFCKTAQENGYKVYCDLSVKATHCMSLEFLNNWKQGTFRFK